PWGPSGLSSRRSGRCRSSCGSATRPTWGGRRNRPWARTTTSCPTTSAGPSSSPPWPPSPPSSTRAPRSWPSSAAESGATTPPPGRPAACSGCPSPAPVFGPPEPSLGPSTVFPGDTPEPPEVLGPPEPRPIPTGAERRRAVPAWLVSAVVVAVALCGAMQYTYKTRNFLPAWIRWNYSGYESKPAYAEFREVITTMAKLPPGRALWEPSSAIDHYGTTLALELLPHFTDGRIASMEGLYFESAATTPYHFVTVSMLAKQPSNPVRNMAPYYRTLADFELGVAQMRVMGVNYYMAQSDEAKAKADASPGLKFLTETGSSGVTPQVARWKIYEVLNSPLVEPLRNEPVVLQGVSHKQWLEPS